MNSDTGQPAGQFVGQLVGQFAPAHLAQWLETTRYYLFSDLESAPSVNTLPRLRQDSHGAQAHFIARVRGRLLRVLKRSPTGGENPLQELERAFYSQVTFIALNPAVPRRMLGWLRDGDARLQRRIQRIIDHYVSRLSGIIEQGKRQGAIRADINPRSAAMRFVAMIQALVHKADAGLHPREGLFRAATTAFALFRADVAASAP